MTWTLDAKQIGQPQGFVAAAAAAGVKKADGRLDVGLIFSTRPSIGTARFTTNVVQAAPLLVCRKNLEESGGEIRALIVNSGNANACTGDGGLRTAWQMASWQPILGIGPQQVLVSSTGVIGIPLPFERIEKQAEALKSALRPEGLDDVAQAIMTTDTVKKVCSAVSSREGVTLKISGMTKGAGMIHPRMATTLGFVLTDVMITRALLEEALGEACEKSYNRISVDGDTSTNDTLAILANGASGAPLIDEKDERYGHFVEGLTAVCQSLAQQIVRDGEGAGKFVEIVVQGAPSETEATQVARSIANSPLVKTAVAGEDANWGRILCAAGYSGARFDPNRVHIRIGELQVCRNGTGLAFDERVAKKILAQRDIRIVLDLNAGNAMSTMWTCDLTKEYIHINADYRT
ncbi:MAG: bifunctional glutamate N-acetyltransferase/amino-acid acetyltransferase ArgJ [Terriglobia bacterium]